MATIYTRKGATGTKFYINIVIDGKRSRRFAGYTKEAAKLKWRCNIHNYEWMQTPKYIRKGLWCKKCNKTIKPTSPVLPS